MNEDRKEEWIVVWNSGQRAMLRRGPDKVYIGRSRDDFASHMFMRLRPGVKIGDATLRILVEALQ